MNKRCLMLPDHPCSGKQSFVTLTPERCRAGLLQPEHFWSSSDSRSRLRIDPESSLGSSKTWPMGKAATPGVNLLKPVFSSLLTKKSIVLKVLAPDKPFKANLKSGQALLVNIRPGPFVIKLFSPVIYEFL